MSDVPPPPAPWPTDPATPVAAPRRGLPPWVLAVVGVLAVLLVLGAIGAATSDREPEPGASGGVPASAGCGATTDHVVPEELQHVTGPVEYEAAPPYGGKHNGTPLPAVRRVIPRDGAPEYVVERAVHNLEHGYVVLWYGLDAPQGRVDAVADEVREADLSKLLMVPYPGQMEEPFVLTAWGHVQPCSEPNAGAMRAFWDAHGGPNGEAPEKNAP